VGCLGNPDIFHRLYGQLRELGWLGSRTMVVIVGDGAEWIRNRATWFIRRCEILDSGTPWSTRGNLPVFVTAKAHNRPITGSDTAASISKPAR
jgi:hypothetical protein